MAGRKKQRNAVLLERMRVLEEGGFEMVSNGERLTPGSRAYRRMLKEAVGMLAPEEFADLIALFDDIPKERK